jgi:hypothetical protein
MATTYKILGQANPALYSNVIVYQVPEGKQAVISTVNICNQSTSASTFRISAVPNTEVNSAVHYLAYDTPIPANDSIALTIGITMQENDHLDVHAITANVSFSVFGSEIN